MARLQLAFFGTFQAVLDQQPITHFRSANNQALLAYLALQPERAFPREVLATLFWPDETDKNARNNLRQAFYQLRKLVGDLEEPDQPHLLLTRQTGQFNIDSDFELDVLEFLRAVEAGDLVRASSYYTGELLPGFTCDSVEFEAWLRGEREHLHRLALEAMAEVTREHLNQGRYDQAQAAAQQQLNLEPWRESAHRQAMRAYAQAGQRGQALRQYERCRAILADELGLEPDADTAALAADISEGRLGAAADQEPLRPPRKARHNLPATPNPLIGRELELAHIERLLLGEAKRLVTIVGPGGMGKTRLALAAGMALQPQFDDGVYLVDLTPLTTPDDIPSALAAALDFQAPEKTQPLWPQLRTTLSQQQILLIFDNFEHLLGGTALVTDILNGCPKAAILVTSRQRLNLASESHFELGGLAFPEATTDMDATAFTAVQLFVDNGRRVRPDFELTDANRNDIIRICRLLQGMPLGLTLAAAWLELLSPAEIAAEIERSLDFLAADLADLPPRQRSMQAVFEWSWATMSTTEQTALAKLSVFRGGFSRAAAEKVAGCNLRTLLSLVSKSLIQRQADNGRFTIHELLRGFAASQFPQDDTVAQAAQAHCRYFAQLVTTEVHRGGYYHPTHLTQQYAADRDNIRQAWDVGLEKGLAAEVAALAHGVVVFRLKQGIQPTAIPAQALTALRQHAIPESDNAWLRLRLLELALQHGNATPEQYWAGLQTFVDQLPGSVDPEIRFWAYQLLGSGYFELQKPESIFWYEQAYHVAGAMGNELLANAALVLQLWVRIAMEAVTDDIPAQLQTVSTYFNQPAFANSFAYFGTLMAAGQYNRLNGDYETAREYFVQAAQIAKNWRDLFWIDNALQNLAQTYELMGQPPAAKLSHLDAIEWHLAIGQTWQTLGNIWGKTMTIPELIGGWKQAVAIQAMTYHHPLATPLYREMIKAFRPDAIAAIGVDAYETAWEKGKELTLETAIAQIKAALSLDNPEASSI